ncbi:hypothetical protein FS837_011775 [Tulasnella sp. UAMH 9824]|nr:hypothetical protein FS837_011775 [Tulasnella sp. UAMH 9824]
MNTIMGMFGGGQKMCLNCRQKPAFQGYDYCGKTCADWARANPPAAQNAPPAWGQPGGPPGGGPPAGWGYPGYGGPPPGPAPGPQGPWPPYNQYAQQPAQAAPPPAAAAPAQAQGGMCQNCHVKPVFPGHPYCSKTCGANAKKNGAQPVPQPPAGPPAQANWGGYPPPPQQWPQGPTPQGPHPQGWPGGPQQQGWGPPPGNQSWGPQQNWGPGSQRPRRNRRDPMPGGYADDDDDDEWPDDDDYDDRPRRRGPRSSLTQKGMCINCRDNPAVGGLEFCSKSCKAEAGARLQGPSGGHRRNSSARDRDRDPPPPRDRRRRNNNYDDD